MKKQKYKSRERFHAVSVELGKEHCNPKTGRVEINLSISQFTGQNKVILAHNNKVVENKSLISGYKGENKFRILSEIPTDKNDHSFDLLRKLLRYDSLVAIDTNSCNHNRTKISLGIACQIGYRQLSGILEWFLLPINQYFVIHGKANNIENRNWMHLINYIIEHKEYHPAKRVGIIVDSDLGNLKYYNNRQKPIADDFYLPNNFELIFASDKATDNILNASILHCHKESKNLLNEFVRDCKDRYGEKN